MIRKFKAVISATAGTTSAIVRRAGTENILLEVALGAACELAQSWLEAEWIRQLRDLFWELLQTKFGKQVVLNGHPSERLYGR